MSMKRIKHSVIFIVMFFAFSHTVSANVIFSEIAWMGTTDSSSNEWIELYNNGGESVDLSGWFIKSGDEDISIPLAGSIIANGYYLIERTDDTTVPSETADLIVGFGHGLSNSGETLILENSSSISVQTVTSPSGWAAGDSTTKETMQWDGSKWITASPTPKDGNIINSNSDTQNETNNTSTSSSSNSTSSSSTPKIEQKVYDISTKIISPKVVTAGVPFSIDHVTTGKNKEKVILGKFVWNFGDGMKKEVSVSDPFEYIYQYPGEYVLTLSFYDSSFDTLPDSTDRLIIKVIPSGITISSIGTYTDSFIEILNNSLYEMSLHSWIIKGAVHSFVIPEGLTILPNKKLKLSPKITGFDFNDLSNILVVDSTGQIFAIYPNKISPRVKYSASQNSQDSNGNIVKGESVNNLQSENESKVINLNNLGANATSSDGLSSLSKGFYSWVGLALVLAIGITSVIFLRRKDEIPDYIEGEISAKDMTIID